MHGPNLDVRHAAEYLGISRSQVYNLISAGDIQPIKIGRSTRIPTGELEGYIQRRIGVARAGGTAA